MGGRLASAGVLLGLFSFYQAWIIFMLWLTRSMTTHTLLDFLGGTGWSLAWLALVARVELSDAAPLSRSLPLGTFRKKNENVTESVQLQCLVYIIYREDDPD